MKCENDGARIVDSNELNMVDSAPEAPYFVQFYCRNHVKLSTP